MIISKEIQFDAGHRVPNHHSKCKNPHGHRYRVVAVLQSTAKIHAEGSSQEGMVMDFGFIKELLTTHIHDELDHGFIVYEKDKVLMDRLQPGDNTEPDDWNVIPFPYVPTAENIAKWSFKELKELVEERSDGCAFLLSIEVWETPTSMATYRLVDYKMDLDGRRD